MTLLIDNQYRRLRQLAMMSVLGMFVATCAADEDVATKAASAGNLSGSLSLERDRAAEQTLQAAAGDFQSGDVASAVGQLQRLFERETDSLAFINGVYRDPIDAAEEMLLSGPGEALRTYQRLFGPLAQQKLEQSLLADNDEGVRLVARHYRHTEAGRRASLHLATLAIDRGDRETAAGWWQQAADLSSPQPATKQRLREAIAQWLPDREADGINPSVTFPDVPETLTAARWRVDVPMTAEARQEIAASLSELDAQGVSPLMSAKPLVHDGVAYVRQLGRIIAVKVSTGEVLWEQTIPTLILGLIQEHQGFENPQRRSMSTALFLERLVRSSLIDRLSTDGQRLFAVLADSSSTRNVLAALSANDGGLMWSAGASLEQAGLSTMRTSAAPRADPSPSGRTKRNDPLRSVFFMGPPEPFGPWCIVVGQKKGMVSLFAIDAKSGHLDWSVPLGRAVRSLSEDKPRYGTACPVTIYRGRAYCPTAAGCLACVDLRSRRLAWAYRYSRDDLPRNVHPEGDPRPDITHATHMPTRDTWQGVFLSVRDGRVLFASPDSDRLHALDARSGQLHWSHPRGQGLFVVVNPSAAENARDRVLVVGTDRATAWAVEDGRAIWSADIERPAGTGFFTETEYAFPLQSGGLQHVRWEDGQTVQQGERRFDEEHQAHVSLAVVAGRKIPVHFGPPSKLQPVEMNNLVAAGDALLLQSFGELIAVATDTDQNFTHADRQSLASAADDRTTDPERAVWSRITNDDRLGSAYEYAMSIARLTHPEVGAARSFVRMARRFVPQLKAPDERAAGLITHLATMIVEDEQTFADSLSTQSTLRQLMRQPVDRIYVSLARPQRSVRLDRWLPHGLGEAVDTDTETRRRLTEQLSSDDAEFTRTEAPKSPDLPGSHSWPEVKPVVSEHPSQGDSIYVNTLPITVTSASPWEHVTIQTDRAGESLWFHRADLTAPVRVSLPPSSGASRMIDEFVHAWASGPLLCVRAGTELFAFRISAADGQLPTAPLWPEHPQTLSIAGDRPQFINGLIESTEHALPLWDDSLPGLFDHFLREFAVVGPVRAKYVCYRDRGHLVALDPLTGREIWCRSGLPVGTHCVGDDDRVVLLHSGSSAVEVLRSLDGANVGTWDWHDIPGGGQTADDAFSHIIAVNRTLALWHSHPPQREANGLKPVTIANNLDETTAAVIDLSTGHRLWSRTVSPGSWLHRLDDALLGSLAADGTLTLWSWETGESVAEHRVNVPPEITEVHVITHAETAFIVASGRPTDLELVGARQIHDGHRRPLVNGWMHAIERATGRHLWEHELDNVGLILDQPRHVPLLVTSYLIQEQGRNFPTGVLKCLDRRSGEPLYELVRPQSQYLYHTVRTDALQNRVELILRDTTVRFDYSTAE